MDVHDLSLRHIDDTPHDYDWSTGWPEEWEFFDATEVSVDASGLYCECGTPLTVEDGLLAHDTDDGETFDHQPLIELEDEDVDRSHYQGIVARKVVFLVAGNSPTIDFLGHDVYLGDGPAMNYWYPCDIDHPVNAALTLAKHHLPLCVVETPSGAGLALTGGGMDLSWEICEAYIRLGYLPPTHFELPAMAGKEADDTNLSIIAAVRRSYEVQRDFMQRSIERLEQTAAGLVN